MAKKKAAPITAPEQREADCQYRQTPTGNYKPGYFRRRCEDGSVELVDKATSNVRTIRAERVQIKSRGKRGATVWVDITAADTTAEEASA